VFDLSIPKLLVLAVIALVVFGPNELPKIAAQAGRALRDLRQIADGLGPEFTGFGIEDLNPKRFVHKHLFGDLTAALVLAGVVSVVLFPGTALSVLAGYRREVPR